MEVLYPRCAGLDVHAGSVTACVRIAVDATVTYEHRTVSANTRGNARRGEPEDRSRERLLRSTRGKRRVDEDPPRRHGFARSRSNCRKLTVHDSGTIEG